MNTSDDQIKTAQKLLGSMEKKEGHTHAKERGYGVYEFRGGVVSRPKK